MRWPWVSVHRYDALTAEYMARSSEMGHRLSSIERQYADLLDKYHALKANGAAPAPVPAERPPADPVTTAINAVAGRNHALRGMMAQAAMEMRRNGIADEVIVRQIYDGIPAIEGLPA